MFRRDLTSLQCSIAITIEPEERSPYIPRPDHNESALGGGAFAGEQGEK
jgi:hypothetical protein